MSAIERLHEKGPESLARQRPRQADFPAADISLDPAADISLDRIGDLLQYDSAQLLKFGNVKGVGNNEYIPIRRFGLLWCHR